MPDYTRNEIVDIIMILEECRGNYHAVAQLYYVRFPDRRPTEHPADIVIARIEKHEKRPRIIQQRRRIIVIERNDP